MRLSESNPKFPSGVEEAPTGAAYGGNGPISPGSACSGCILWLFQTAEVAGRWSELESCLLLLHALGRGGRKRGGSSPLGKKAGMCIKLSPLSISAFCLRAAPLPTHSCTNPFCSLPSASIQAATAAQMFPIKHRAMPTNFGTHESVLRNGPQQIPFFPSPLPFLQVFLNANGFHAATASGGGLWNSDEGQIRPGPKPLVPLTWTSWWCFPKGDAAWRQQAQPSLQRGCRWWSGENSSKSGWLRESETLPIGATNLLLCRTSSRGCVLWRRSSYCTLVCKKHMGNSHWRHIRVLLCTLLCSLPGRAEPCPTSPGSQAQETNAYPHPCQLKQAKAVFARKSIWSKRFPFVLAPRLFKESPVGFSPPLL